MKSSNHSPTKSVLSPFAQNKLPKDWKWVKFEDLLDYIQPTKYIVESTEYSDDFKTPVLTAGKSFILGNTNETEGIFNSLPVIIFDDFTTANKFVNFPFKVKSSAMKILKPKSESVNIKFVFYYMQTVHITFDTHKRYWISVFSKLLVPLPSSTHQQVIVSKIEELFSEIDKGVENLKLAQQQLKTYRQSVLKWAFEGKLTKGWRESQVRIPAGSRHLNTGSRVGVASRPQEELLAAEPAVSYKNRRVQVPSGVEPKCVPGAWLEPAHVPGTGFEPTRARRGSEPPINGLPEGWKWLKNKDILKYVTSGSRDWKKYYSTKGSRFVRTQDINSNKLELENSAFVTLPEKVEGKRSLIEEGDILMTITGANVGRIAVVDFPIKDAYVSQSVALLKYKDNRITKYLWYYFQAEGFGKSFIEKLVYGVGRPVLSLENMRDVDVLICSLEEQQEIVKQLDQSLSKCDKLDETINCTLKHLEALRQSILKKAFEGKLIR